MACLHYLVYLSLLVELAIFSTGQIPIGSQLSASQNQVWLSENSTFAFGFTSSGSDGQFLLAIWYSKLPGDPTVTWSPNRESPVGSDATVKLDLTGNLVLVDGNSSLWMSNTSHQGVKYAVMSESGSFILYNGSSNDSQIAWQSFWHPSDTLLPGQELTGSLELSSVKSSLGYYSLKMLQQRTSLSLALTYVSLESSGASPEYYANYSYWSSPEISNATGDVVAVLDQSGNFGIKYGSSSSGTMYVHKNDSGGSTSPRRITIGTDGNLRLYRWDEAWVTEWSALSNPCMAAGVCGSGVCTLDSSKTNSSCTCLQGNSSASSGDKACSLSSLKPSSVKCSENHGIGITMETVAQTNYYFSGASTVKNYSNVMVASQCAEYCLSDCDCVAAVYGLEDDKPSCWTLKSLVFGGFQDPSATLYMKVGSNGSQAGGSSSGDSSSSKGAQAVVLPLVLCTSAVIALLIFLLCYNIRRRRIMQHHSISSSLSFPGAPVFFSFHVLQSATENFSRLIGTGGFGSVYKGTLRDGTLIAVKKLERMLPQGEREFITEVTTIGSMHHMNLVSLRGFCSEGSHRLLVYEYMSNGSLDKWIFPTHVQQDKLLDWKTRFNIAIAIAEGFGFRTGQANEQRPL
ncbi:Non-specific serine/threonine protein kinase protein [Dioscorea alata]|uniref:Non-specific serine/threonine protein kinase protein n=1 Tax=Dioscorea alata TaxID=55571 RepID=A0ACB7TUP7_DIOAL|nr:Non-specific serine/threonine protein kinase protein [Dioscorea alata]